MTALENHPANNKTSVAQYLSCQHGQAQARLALDDALSLMIFNRRVCHVGVKSVVLIQYCEFSAQYLDRAHEVGRLLERTLLSSMVTVYIRTSDQKKVEDIDYNTGGLVLHYGRCRSSSHAHAR